MADAAQAAPRALGAPDVVARKGSGTPLVMVTAYDAPSARAVDTAGVDMILVGDSVAMVVLGYDDTLHVTVDDMAHHTGAVARTKPRALVVADLPWMSYHRSPDETVANAAQLVRAGATAVKLEGGRKRVDAIHAILDAEIPVMGHLGLTPQSVHRFGGFRVQGKTLDAAREIVDDAVALAEAGCSRSCSSACPTRSPAWSPTRCPCPRSASAPVATATARCSCTTTSSASRTACARSSCAATPTCGEATRAIERFADDVRAGRFPASGETYHAADTVTEALGLYGSVEHASA